MKLISTDKLIEWIEANYLADSIDGQRVISKKEITDFISTNSREYPTTSDTNSAFEKWWKEFSIEHKHELDTGVLRLEYLLTEACKFGATWQREQLEAKIESLQQKLLDCHAYGQTIREQLIKELREWVILNAIPRSYMPFEKEQVVDEKILLAKLDLLAGISATYSSSSEKGE